MIISIYGPMKAKPMKIQGITWVSEYRLQYYLKIIDWYHFIEYIKQYKNKGE